VGLDVLDTLFGNLVIFGYGVRRGPNVPLTAVQLRKTTQASEYFLKSCVRVRERGQMQRFVTRCLYQPFLLSEHRGSSSFDADRGSCPKSSPSTSINPPTTKDGANLWHRASYEAHPTGYFPPVSRTQVYPTTRT
jgi:hypothetical protein